MVNQNVIHIKLEYEEALQSKRDMLLSEVNLLRIIKMIKKYHWLRAEELKIKLKMYRKIKQIIINTKKLQTTLPELKIPRILKDEYNRESDVNEIKEEIEETKSPYDENLEVQLQEIQEKLRSIGR